MSDRRANWRGADGLYICRKLGLTNGLKLVLDAGSADSYAGSGQKWLDLSGNGYDFFLGADGSSAADDPTFNGSAGQRSASEYFSFDGGDRFTYDTTNEAWMQALHQDNAIFAAAVWAYLPNVTTSQRLWGTTSTSATGGLGCRAGFASTFLTLVVHDGANGNALTQTGSVAIPTSVPVMLSCIQSEAVGAGGLIFGVNGSFEALTSTYTNPSASNALATFQIGASSGGGVIQNGSRIYSMAMWQGELLSPGQMQAYFNATRGRFGV